MAIALLIVRVILGLGIAAHGAQKLFGWFGGYGIKGTGGFFETIGFRPGNFFAAAAGLGEFGGGALTVLGVGGPIGPAIIIMVMLVAILAVHWGHGFFTAKNGSELPLTYASGSLLLMFTGPGPYSIDSLLGLSGVWSANLTWIALGVAILLALGNLVVRRSASQQQPASEQGVDIV
jgi:putative oxidoreductase